MDGEPCQLCAGLRQELEDLRRSLPARDCVGEAKGLLMAAHQCTPDEAFRMLLTRAQDADTTVVEIAEDLVDTAVRRYAPAVRHLHAVPDGSPVDPRAGQS